MCIGPALRVAACGIDLPVILMHGHYALTTRWSHSQAHCGPRSRTWSCRHSWSKTNSIFSTIPRTHAISKFICYVYFRVGRSQYWYEIMIFRDHFDIEKKLLGNNSWFTSHLVVFPNTHIGKSYFEVGLNQTNTRPKLEYHSIIIRWLRNVRRKKIRKRIVFN